MDARRLTLCEFNVENLFLGLEYERGQDLERLTEEEWRALALPQLRRNQKPLKKLWGLSNAILDIAADIVMLVEVGGRESLENFNERFLGGRFATHFVEGNSRRGIDLGFLVSKQLPFTPRAFSNRDVPVTITGDEGRYESRFSRDVAELRLYDEDKLVLILLLVHLKSKLSRPMDFRGKNTRTAEAFALASFYQAHREKHAGVPIVLAGDFNADLTSVELELVRRTNLVDAHLEIPREERTTFMYFEGADVPQPLVLDYLLVSPELQTRIVPEMTYVYRYKNDGIAEPLPRSVRERNQLPSDHYPVVVTLALT